MTIKDRLAELTRPTGEEEIMPVDYPKPRFQISVTQAAGALAIVVALCAVWVAVRAGGSAEHENETWDTQHAAAGPSGHAGGPVVVSVVGAVENPGLVTLDAGARVADALAVARPRPDADLLSLNQAQVLVDGQQIVVLVVGQAPPPGADAPSAPGAGGGQGGISLNTASAAELTELPGVGEATAAAIVAYREEKGPFRTVEQLMEVKGIGPAKFEAVKDLVVL